MTLVSTDADWRFTTSGAAMLGLLRFAQALGVGHDGLTTGIEPVPEHWTDPECRVRQGNYHLLWERLAARAPFVDAPGLVAARAMDLDSFGVVLHLAAGCKTFGAALAKVEHYARLLHDAGGVEVVREGERATIYPGCRGHVGTPRHVAEFSLGSVVCVGRLLTGQAWQPQEVHFRQPRPADTGAHKALFGVEPVFDAPETLIIVASSVLELPVVGAQASLAPFLEAFATRALERLPATATGIETVVRQLVAKQLANEACDAVEVAHALGIHVRTLRRHLAAAGTSFHEVRDAVRLEHAAAHLEQGRLSITDIAYLLGYTDPANFHRAFKRWTGTSPSTYRSLKRSSL